jgi:hypothetical protein
VRPNRLPLQRLAKSARIREAGCVFWGVTWEYCCSDVRELVDDNVPISLSFASTANPGRGAVPGLFCTSCFDRNWS